MSLVDEYEGEDFEEDHSSTLPEETLGEDEIVEPSPEVIEQQEISEDLVPISQYPQEEPTPLASTPYLIQYSHKEFIPLTLVDDLFLELTKSSFLKDPALAMTKFSILQVDLMSPIDQCSNLKVIPSNQGLFHASNGLSQDSDSYFLPYPKASNVSQTFQLHFVEVVRLHQFFEYVRFATYFWKTLWHLLGVHYKFSCACQTRVKPRESIVC